MGGRVFPKFLVILYYFRTVVFYLGRGATWGINSTECGLPRLV